MIILKILNYWCYRVSNPANQNQICRVSNLSTNIMIQELQDTESRHAQGMKYYIIILELQGIESLPPNIKILKLLNICTTGYLIQQIKIICRGIKSEY